MSQTLSAEGERNCTISNVFETRRTTKKPCTYKEEKERKNGIKDNILFSKKKHMKGRSIQYHANEEARRNSSKRDVLQRRKVCEGTHHR
jgi:hypothetical protein